MMMLSSCETVVVFDLDDTLYKEVDYLLSGYNAIAEIIVNRSSLSKISQIVELMKEWRFCKKDVFDELCRLFPDAVTKEECLNIYRYHFPAITLDDDSLDVLTTLKEHGCIIGIITDGREITQRNKIKALGLDEFVKSDDIVISEAFGSEKPDERNYRYFMDRYPDSHYIYIADNVRKDFITPNRLGWRTICLLDDGRNIHKQDFSMTKEYLPQIRIENHEKACIYNCCKF